MSRRPCAPRGSVRPQWTAIYDPTFSGKRIVPRLVYTSDWLKRSGMLDRASSHRWKLEAHINPSDLSKVWVNLNGIKCLDLKSADPDMLQVTLLDWLAISRDDRLIGFLAHVDKTKEGVNRVASIKLATKEADRERNAEIKARGTKPTKTEQKRAKRDNTAAERAAMTGVPRPPKRKAPQQTSHPPAVFPTATRPVHPAQMNSDLSAAIRATRQY